MPIERVSAEFRDISSSFKVNPLNFDIIALKNETAIARSVRNLVLTGRQERFFNPDLGSNVNRLLFEPLDDITASSIRSEIENTINNFEPRVELIETVVTPNYDSNEFDVRIRYRIVGIDVLPQQLSFALQPTR